MANQGFLLMFSCEGNETSSAAENSGFKCINQNTVHNTVNRWMWRESNSFRSSAAGHFVPVGIGPKYLHMYLRILSRLVWISSSSSMSCFGWKPNQTLYVPSSVCRRNWGKLRKEIGYATNGPFFFLGSGRTGSAAAKNNHSRDGLLIQKDAWLFTLIGSKQLNICVLS